MTGRKILAALVLVGAAVLCTGAPAGAYIEAPYSLGRLVSESTNILIMQVDKVDKQNNRILYKKVRDVKGKHPQDQVRHNIGQRGSRSVLARSDTSQCAPGPLPTSMPTSRPGKRRTIAATVACAAPMP